MPDNASLDKKDVQLFMKRLRKNDGQNKIRYFAVGEYGTKGNRPHYHLLLFNSDEATIRKSWELGIVHVGTVTLASVAYCTKYIVQPTTTTNPKLQKPFSLMSRAYGIGLHYLTDDMVEWHRSGDKNYTDSHGTKGRLPRYYREKIWYRETDRSRVSLKSKWLAIKNARLELRFFANTYGENAHKMLKEFRNAHLAKIKIKVAFTQTL